MMDSKQSILRIVFEFSHYVRDNSGEIDKIAFLDDSNTSMILDFNPLNDYSQNIEVIVKKDVYLKNKGSGLTPKETQKIISLASGKEILTSKPVGEGEGEAERVFKIVFRRGNVKLHSNKLTGESYYLHKYFDAVGNYIYFRTEDFLRIFSTENIENFVFINLTYSAYKKALDKTKNRYPWMNTAFLTQDLVTSFEAIDLNRYDLNVLKIIYAEQRKGNPKYDGIFEEVYERVSREFIENNETNKTIATIQPTTIKPRRKVTIETDSSDYDYEFNTPNVTSEQEDEEVAEIVNSGEKVDGRKAGAAKREKARREAMTALRELQKRVAELEAENRGLRRLRDIADGEDPEFIATFHQINKS